MDPATKHDFGNEQWVPRTARLPQTVQALRLVSLRLRISLRALSVLSFCWCYRNTLELGNLLVASLLWVRHTKGLRPWGCKTQPPSLLAILATVPRGGNDPKRLFQMSASRTLQWRKKAHSSLAACGACRAASPAQPEKLLF